MASDVLTKVLLTISNTLLIPVISCLIVFAGITIVYVGGLIGEMLTRWQQRAVLRKLLTDLKRQPERHLTVEDVPEIHSWLPLSLDGASKETCEKWLDDIQLGMESSLSYLHMGIRLGPILGLAGTLIPLGPALAALSGGNIPTFSQNVVVSFTTTVVGLFIGGVCFVMHTIRQRWYKQDLNDIAFIVKRLEAPARNEVAS
jgi:biopolymer transport protein ExbB/TolQ